MSNRFLSLLLAAVAAIILLPDASAQTCRVRCGQAADGTTIYKEVYEYDYVSEKPSFPGGNCCFMSFINRTREYPAAAYKNGIQGRVVCSFVVNVDGSISNIEVIKGVEGTLNHEAVRILSLMPDWTPGRIDGRPVPVRVIHPVPFRR